MKNNAPILEFDQTTEAILEPAKIIRPIDAPEHCVLCFFQDVLARLAQQVPFRKIARQRSEMGTHPLWEFEHRGQRLAVFHPGIGGAFAATLFEEIIARGCRKFVACGSAGVLDDDIAMGHVLVPVAAIRDEGVSFHYLPASREVAASPAAVTAIEKSLAQQEIPFIKTKTWTTAALYRETRQRMDQRKKDGCLAVDMAAASQFAVAQFRRDRAVSVGAKSRARGAEKTPLMILTTTAGLPFALPPFAELSGSPVAAHFHPAARSPGRKPAKPAAANMPGLFFDGLAELLPYRSHPWRIRCFSGIIYCGTDLSRGGRVVCGGCLEYR